MYQKQQIIFDKDSTEAKKFYEEQIKGYISYLENNIVTYENDGETFEDRVNFTVSEDEQDNTVTITLDEDWRLMFRKYSFVSDSFGDEYKHKMLLNAYLSADSEIKKAVRFRYAHRTVKECVLEANRNNIVEVFDSANLSAPIVVRSDFVYYKPLPVKETIALDDLPDKKWYPARTYIEVMRCDGTCIPSEPADRDLFTFHELNEFDNEAPVSDEAVKAVEENKDFIKDCGIPEDSITEGFPDTWDEKTYSTIYWIMDDPGELTTSALKQYAEKIEKLIKNCEFVNEKCGFDTSDPLYTIQCISIMMYSDDFDAVEVTTDTFGKIVCRFFENGKTSVIDSDKMATKYTGFGLGRVLFDKTREIFGELSEDEKRAIEDDKMPCNIKEFDLCSPKLAEMISGFTLTDDFNGNVVIDGDKIHIEARADDLFDSLLLAYHNYPQVIEELNEMKELFIFYSPELIAPGLMEMLRDMPSEDIPDGITVAEGNKVMIKDFHEKMKNLSDDKYPELRTYMARLRALSGINKRNAFDDSIIWLESRERYVDDNGSIWSEKLEYSGRIGYTYYRCFLNDISDGAGADQNAVRSLWVGMKHECGEDEFSIEHEVRKLGDVRLDDLNEIHITGSCEQIATEAMLGCKNLQKAYIYSYNIQFPDDKVFPDGVTIITYKGSTAVPYAKKFGYALELM